MVGDCWNDDGVDRDSDGHGEDNVSVSALILQDDFVFSNIHSTPLSPPISSTVFTSTDCLNYTYDSPVSSSVSFLDAGDFFINGDQCQQSSQPTTMLRDGSVGISPCSSSTYLSSLSDEMPSSSCALSFGNNDELTAMATAAGMGIITSQNSHEDSFFDDDASPFLQQFRADFSGPLSDHLFNHTSPQSNANAIAGQTSSLYSPNFNNNNSPSPLVQQIESESSLISLVMTDNERRQLLLNQQNLSQNECNEKAMMGLRYQNQKRPIGKVIVVKREAGNEFVEDQHQSMLIHHDYAQEGEEGQDAELETFDGNGNTVIVRSNKCPKIGSKRTVAAVDEGENKYFVGLSSSPPPPITPPPKTRSKMHDLAVRHQLITNQVKDMRSHGVIQLSTEERRTLIQEGFQIPTKLPLLRDEEEALKIIRRKIKNKLSAQESRRKRKEYVDSLERKIQAYFTDNNALRQKVRQLEITNECLLTQLNKNHSNTLEAS